MSNATEIFQNKHIILPVIHAETEDQVLMNARVAYESGCDGVFLINMQDPKTLERMSHENLYNIHQMVRREFATWWIGVNYLDLPTVKIIEPGAWGSAANALRTVMPEQNFELYFMFSHMPEYIYGFLNDHSPGVESRYFEVINDTAEAVPKPYVRPETLVVHKDMVVADLNGKIIESPFMKVWSWAVNQGAYDAGVDFAQGKRVDVAEHVKSIIELSKLSAQGKWTGVLPRNTLTWTAGEKWHRDWKWGKIPPLT